MELLNESFIMTGLISCSGSSERLLG